MTCLIFYIICYLNGKDKVPVTILWTDVGLIACTTSVLTTFCSNLITSAL